MINIENLAYGNLDKTNLKFMNKASFFSDYIDIFNNINIPPIKETEKEIEYLIRTQKEYMGKPNWEEYKKFITGCDENIKGVLYNSLNRMGVRFTKENSNELEKIQELLGSLIMSLKSHYNRARPFQVAYYTKQNLHPLYTASGNSPSYPSGHAAQSRFLLKIVAFNFPEFKNEIKKLADEIAFTRIVMGVHYPSDNQFGFEIADRLAAIPKLKDLYFSNKIF